MVEISGGASENPTKSLVQHRLRVFRVKRVDALVDQVADFGFVRGFAVLDVHRTSPWNC
jgi:hypothetical protein